jgi:hypothetical protein
MRSPSSAPAITCCSRRCCRVSAGGGGGPGHCQAPGPSGAAGAAAGRDHARQPPDAASRSNTHLPTPSSPPPGAVSGIVSEASIVESIRNIMADKVGFWGGRGWRVVGFGGGAQCYAATGASCWVRGARAGPRFYFQPLPPPLPSQGVYYEARAVGVDPGRRQLTCVKEFCEVGWGGRGAGGGGGEGEGREMGLGPASPPSLEAWV